MDVMVADAQGSGADTVPRNTHDTFAVTGTVPHGPVVLVDDVRLREQAAGIVAGDLPRVETVWLMRLHVRCCSSSSTPGGSISPG
jgi:hypothetical protein